MAGYNFNTDLTVKPQEYGSNLGDIVNMARGVQAYQKQAATMPYEIQQQKTASEKGVFELNQKQTQALYDLAGAALQDPRLKTGKPEDAMDVMIEQKERARSLGLPEKTVESVFAPYTYAAVHKTSLLPQMLANTIQGGIGAQGQAQQSLVSAGAQQQVGGTDISGNPTVYQRDRFGNIVQTPLPVGGVAGQAPGNMRIAPGESQETIQGFQADRALAKQAATAAAPALNNIQTVRKFLPLAQVGKYSEAVAGMQSVLGNLAGSTPEEKAASARDIIQKNIADLASQKNAALGGKFAADLNAAQESIASAGKNPTAILKSMQQLEPLVQHSLNYQQGLEKAIAKNGGNIQVKRKFDNEMIDAFDPQAMMVYNAYKSGDKQEFAELTKGMSETKKREIATKMQRYNSLINGDI